ncbi:MAG: NAD(P)/FAD-dependent oxidoreductase [Rhizobiaceae bacterium]
MTPRNLFTPNFKATPYWWEQVQSPNNTKTALPAKAQVLIIGSGYTGLHAAIQTARAGKRTIVIDAQTAGWGCSTRNGGQISTSIKPGYQKLARRYGDNLAKALLAEGQASRDYIEKFIRTEKIKCDFSVCGRFHGAHSQRHFDKLVRECSAPPNPVFDTNAFVVSRQEQARELGTDAYFGGIVYPNHASIDPAKYHSGLIVAARNAGVEIISQCAAEDISSLNGKFEVKTSKGSVKSEKVVVATNGYTGSLTPWLRNRVIPIGSYIIATEEIPQAIMDRLFPTSRILSDTRKLVYYYRPTPDRKRILFGGRVSLYETDPRKSGPKLHRDLVALFPELQDIRISHSWAGFVGYTFDDLMHTGEKDGLIFATGYCGSGVGMASYLGMRIGQQTLGNVEGITAFGNIPFKGRPYYSGIPWFLAPSVMVYRLRDKLGY